MLASPQGDIKSKFEAAIKAAMQEALAKLGKTMTSIGDPLLQENLTANFLYYEFKGQDRDAADFVKLAADITDSTGITCSAKKIKHKRFGISERLNFPMEDFRNLLRRQAEEEARRQAEEAQRKAAEEAQRKAELEAQRKAEEEAQRRELEERMAQLSVSTGGASASRSQTLKSADEVRDQDIRNAMTRLINGQTAVKTSKTSNRNMRYQGRYEIDINDKTATITFKPGSFKWFPAGKILFNYMQRAIGHSKTGQRNTFSQGNDTTSSVMSFPRDLCAQYVYKQANPSTRRSPKPAGKPVLNFSRRRDQQRPYTASSSTQQQSSWRPRHGY